MSADLEGPVARPEARLERPAGVRIGTYTFVLALILLFTVIEIAVLNVRALEGVQKPLIVALLAANFGLSALYYQGLQYENGVNKLTFGVGLALGVLTAVSLLILLPLGITVKP